MISSRNFNKTSQITCLAFDPNGNYIAVGFKNGHLTLIDAISLSDVIKAPFNYSKDAISHIEFAHDSSYLATAVTIFEEY
jgi:WD40 repeat protein